MNLESLIDDSITDKNSLHSYLPVYEYKLAPRRESVKRVLEIGVQRGGSMKLWAEYFPNAEIWGMDVQEGIPSCCVGNPRIKILQANAYDVNVVNEFTKHTIQFDVIIDDGPHTLESMVFFTKYYTQLLAPGGVMICEDIPSHDWIEAIHACTPAKFKKYAEWYDLRSIKQRYDDILYVIDHKVEALPSNLAGLRMEIN